LIRNKFPGSGADVAGTVLDTTCGRRQYGGCVRHAAFVHQPSSGRTTETGLHVEDLQSGPCDKRHGIHKLIVIGLIAHTCVEATVRFAAELGYEVTVVKDATASYSDEEMHAALHVNLPNYASAIVTANQIVDSLSAVQT
jgi:nicotinamidase-related amidase